MSPKPTKNTKSEDKIITNIFENSNVYALVMLVSSMLLYYYSQFKLTGDDTLAKAQLLSTISEYILIATIIGFVTIKIVNRKNLKGK